MNKLWQLILIIGVLFVAGCVTTHQYQGNNFPSFSSSSFPFFNPTSEIIDGIKIKLSEASGKTKMTMNITGSAGQENISVNIESDSTWDINVENNLIYNNSSTKMTTNAPDGTTTSNTKFESIYETSGKEIKINFSTDDNNIVFTIEERENFKKEMSDWINYQFANLGKTVKTGDVLRNLPNIRSVRKNILDQNQNIPEKTTEIIKGMGVYKNKKVIVTEYRFEDSIHNSEFIAEIKGKGYNLYDAETFIQLFGEGVGYASAFSPKEGTIYFKMDWRSETYDVQVRNIIDSPSLTDRDAEKESAKSSWSEASDKIKALGELFEKGLISKEEYETKKNELLKNF